MVEIAPNGTLIADRDAYSHISVVNTENFQYPFQFLPVVQLYVGSSLQKFLQIIMNISSG